MNWLYEHRLLRPLDRGGNPKSMNEMVVDSTIISMIALFSNLVGTGFPPSANVWWTAFIAFGISFFTQLAYERKIHKARKRLEEERQND